MIDKFTVTVTCPVEKQDIHFDFTYLNKNHRWVVCDRRIASGAGTVYEAHNLDAAIKDILTIE